MKDRARVSMIQRALGGILSLAQLHPHTTTFYTTIDHLLAGWDLSASSTPVLVALLRATWPARSGLAHWTSTLQQVASLLDERGEDTDSLLIGLRP